MLLSKPPVLEHFRFWVCVVMMLLWVGCGSLPSTLDPGNSENSVSALPESCLTVKIQETPLDSRVSLWDQDLTQLPIDLDCRDFYPEICVSTQDCQSFLAQLVNIVDAANTHQLLLKRPPVNFFTGSTVDLF